MESPKYSTDDLTGTTLVERFHINGKLGRGGMGAIYTAHDSILDRDVAIKTIARTNLNDQELVRFQREARAASTLRHPNVIQLLDFGILESGQPFMVMELIQGLSLSQLIAEKGPQSPRFVLQIIEQVASGMIGVHKSGIVHRDLKTGNIMLMSAGMATNQPLIKILDFGIAKSLGPEIQVSTLTKAGQIFGSPNSMSPEQVQGERLDHRSDIYALGCIAFELLTGRPLFVGDSVMDVVTQHINEPPPRLWEACELTFPMELERLVAHMVLKDPDERFQSMEEVIRNLREVYAALPDELGQGSMIALPVETDQPASPGKNLNRKGVVIVGLITFLALVGSVSYIVSTLTPPKKIKIKEPFKTALDSAPVQLAMVDKIHNTDSPFGSYALNHSGRVTKRLANLITEKKHVKDLLLIGSEIVPEDTNLIASLRPQLLNLAGCSGVTEEVMKGLSSIPSIQVLNLQKVKGLTPAGLVCLGKLPYLSALTVVDCDLNDEHVKAMRDLNHLILLKLQLNKKISMKGIRALGTRKRRLTIEVDQPTIALLAESQKNKLRNNDKIVLLKEEAQGDVSAKAIESITKYAMDDLLGPVGNSKGDKDTFLNSLPDLAP